MQTNIDEAQVIILLEKDGDIHLVAMEKDKFEGLGLLIKCSISTIVKTKKTHLELMKYLGAVK